MYFSSIPAVFATSVIFNGVFSCAISISVLNPMSFLLKDINTMYTFPPCTLSLNKKDSIASKYKAAQTVGNINVR